MMDIDDIDDINSTVEELVILEIGRNMLEQLAHYDMLIFLDSSARPLSYVYRLFRGEKKDQQIFFTNPSAFSSSTNDEGIQVAFQFLQSYPYIRSLFQNNGGDFIFEGNEIKIYPASLHTSFKVCIVDTCVHTGSSILPVLGTLKLLGFQTYIYIQLANPAVLKTILQVTIFMRMRVRMDAILQENAH